MTTPPTDYSRMFDVTGRVALVVGAGSGIGQASAQALGAFGAHVISADVKADTAEATAQAIRDAGGQASSLVLDMRSRAEIARALATVAPPDILVSTPSINVRKPVLNYTEDEFDRVVGLNLKGTFLLLQEVIRGETVEPGQGVYAATKAGVRQLCRALASELGPIGVRVNLIAPGVVETPLTAQIKNNPAWYQAYAEKGALRRWAQPSELAGAVVYLASDASSYVTGSVLYVDGGWMAQDGRFTPPL